MGKKWAAHFINWNWNTETEILKPPYKIGEAAPSIAGEQQPHFVVFPLLAGRHAQCAGNGRCHGDDDLQHDVPGQGLLLLVFHKHFCFVFVVVLGEHRDTKSQSYLVGPINFNFFSVSSCLCVLPSLARCKDTTTHPMQSRGGLADYTEINYSCEQCLIIPFVLFPFIYPHIRASLPIPSATHARRGPLTPSARTVFFLPRPVKFNS